MYRKDLKLHFRSGNFLEDNNGRFGQFIADHELEYTVDMDNNSCEDVFDHIRSFLRGMGALDNEIVRGACGIVFAGGYDTTTTQMIQDIGEFTPNQEVEQRIESEVNIQMGNYMQVDRVQDKQNWESRYWDLQKEYQEKMLEMKAKISRLENPDQEELTPEEKNHIQWHAQQNGGSLDVVSPEEEVHEEEVHDEVNHVVDDTRDDDYKAFELDHKHSY